MGEGSAICPGNRVDFSVSAFGSSAFRISVDRTTNIETVVADHRLGRPHVEQEIQCHFDDGLRRRVRTHREPRTKNIQQTGLVQPADESRLVEVRNHLQNHHLLKNLDVNSTSKPYRMVLLHELDECGNCLQAHELSGRRIE